MTAPDGEVSLLDFAAVLLRRWRMVVGLPLVATAVAVFLSQLVPPTYTATTTFVPEEPANARLPASLAGIAGQFGISVGTDGSRSPRFYAEVLKSRQLLERALLASYPVPRAATNDSIQLLHILGLRGSGSDSLSNGVRKLARLVVARVDNQTNMVRLSVQSRYPEIAAAVANRLIAYLNEFNTATRQSQARERRRFVEQRIVEAETELRGAEGDLRGFYERNRTWQQSPQLVFEEGRLRRQVEIRQEVYLTLKREFETARIEEVNDTPVITVIDPAVTPHRASWPRVSVVVVLAMGLGTLVSVAFAFGSHFLEQARTHDGTAYAEVSERWRDVGRQIRRLFGLAPR